MKLLTLKCPSCGSNLSIENGRDFTFCQYCGTKILIEKNNEFTYRHIDDAAVRRAETERIVKLKELELEKERRGNRKALIIAWAIVTGLLILSGIVLMTIGREETTSAGGVATLIGMSAGMWGAIFLFSSKNAKSKPNAETNNTASNTSYKQNNRSTQEIKRGMNLKYNLALNPTEALSGVRKTIKINYEDVCDICNGRGFINTTRCAQCNGSGKYNTIKPLSVTIPAGVKTGEMLLVKGEGEPGINGGHNGDLYIEILVR